MIDPVLFIAFVPAALALNLTPGADMLFCLGQGLRAGPRAAIAASAGVSAGAMVHVSLAGLGLGAVIGMVPWAFDVIRWFGVAYLLWLALGQLRAAGVASAALRTDQDTCFSVSRAFRAGFIVNLTNPKVILFVLAFVPPFISPDAGPVLAQFLIYGALMAGGGLIVNGGVGVFASVLGARLVNNSAMICYVTAVIFTVLAIHLARLSL